MSDSTNPRRTRREQRQQSEAQTGSDQVAAPRRRWWIWVIAVAIVLATLVAVGIWAAQRIMAQAEVARTHLTAAMPYAEDLQAALLASDAQAAAAAAQAFSDEAAKAESATSGRLWEAASSIPVPNAENLRAVRLVTQIAQSLGADVLTPASGLDLNALKPVQGRIDVATVQALSTKVNGMEDSVASSIESLADIDRSALIGQVDGGVSDLESTLERLHGVLEPAQGILSVLPEALGADQPRNYLLMFLGNAEIRAGGGGPGSFILLRAENGGLTIAREAAATDFPIALPEPIIPLDPETEAVYSPVIGRYIANLTGTPDFPTTAALARGWWQSEFDDQIDGVIGIDPVALSYLLRATGPLALPTGEMLTPDNAVALLLNEAYFEYPTGVESNVFFAGAAATVFSALTSGSPNPVGLVDALSQAGEEGRLKIWTADPEEQALLGSSQLAGVLPTDNTDETAVGVFINDTTGAKMDYYADAAVSLSTDQCSAEAEPSWTTTLTFTNSISREDAADLPRYITGLIYEPGDIVSDFLVYSPVGATIESWTLDGKEYPATSRATHLGRDVLRVALVTGPVSASTLTVTMKGAPGADADAYGPASVRSTPMVRDTPVTIDAPGCE